MGKRTPSKHQSGRPEKKLGLSLFSVIILPIIEQFYLSVHEMVSFNLSTMHVFGTEADRKTD